MNHSSVPFHVRERVSSRDQLNHQALRLNSLRPQSLSGRIMGFLWSRGEELNGVLMNVLVTGGRQEGGPRALLPVGSV